MEINMVQTPIRKLNVDDQANLAGSEEERCPDQWISYFGTAGAEEQFVRCWPSQKPIAPNSSSSVRHIKLERRWRNFDGGWV